MINVKYFQREQACAHVHHVTLRGIVPAWHKDHREHMNVQRYIGIFEQATWVLLSKLGLNARYFRENRRGMAPLEQVIKYEKELTAGDVFEIRSAIVGVSERTVRFFHNIYKVATDTLAASTTILAVHMDPQADTSVPLPAAVQERARELLNSQAAA